MSPARDAHFLTALSLCVPNRGAVIATNYVVLTHARSCSENFPYVRSFSLYRTAFYR